MLTQTVQRLQSTYALGFSWTSFSKFRGRAAFRISNECVQIVPDLTAFRRAEVYSRATDYETEIKRRYHLSASALKVLITNK
jgi:hypothetical protein